jgi:K+-sensing histidine kinase KdpD
VKQRDGEWLAAGAIGALVAIGASLALVPLRDVIDNANVALSMVLVVVVCGYFGGRVAGVGAAVGATLGFDFFHTQPYLHLRIHSSDDVVTTVLLLVIGLVVGQLAVRARRHEQRAEAGHTEVDRVWRVAELAARDADPRDIETAVRAELLSLLHLTDCRYEPGVVTALPVMAPEGMVPDTLLVYRDGGFQLPAGGFALRVGIGDRTFGHFVCRPTPGMGIPTDAKHVAIVLVDELALALAARSRPNAAT